jgi:HEAT repeat protein
MTEAIPTLRAFLNDSSPDVRQAAEAAIENLEDYFSD